MKIMLIKESNQTDYVARYHTTDEITSIPTAIEWLCGLRGLKDIATEKILCAEYVPGKVAIARETELDPLSSIDEIAQVCRQNAADAIALIGEYRNGVITVGIDLKGCFIAIATGKDNAADITALEEMLRL